MNRNEINHFAVNPINLDISRSIFNRDHKVLFSGNVGDTIPWYCEEVLPGDTFKVTTSKVVRLQPLVTPIMDNLYLDTMFFFVPTRLVWEHWKEFNGENTQTAWIPTASYTIPQITVPSGGFAKGTIADYMGIPIGTGAGKTISALPFRAYALCVNEWMRDENLMNPVHVHVDDTTRTGVNSADQVTDIELGGKPFIACKFYDYFTGCLPGAQKATGTMIQFALNGLLPVNAYYNKSNITVGENLNQHQNGGVGNMRFRGISSGIATDASASGNHNLFLNGELFNDDSNNYSVGGSSWNVTPYNLFADLNNTSIFDINSLRQAFAIQRYYEKQARGGKKSYCLHVKKIAEKNWKAA